MNPTVRAAMAYRWTILLGVLVGIAIWSRPALAYPWTIKHGYTGCTACHADPSGGELLTRYGRVQGNLLLRMHYTASAQTASASESGNAVNYDSWDDDSDTAPSKPSAAPQAQSKAKTDKEGSAEPAEANPGFLWGLWDPPEPLLLGGSYRHMLLVEPKTGSVHTFPMQADLYGGLSLGFFRAGASVGVTRVQPGSPYGRAALITSGDSTNLLSRTHWIGAQWADGRALLRAGRINLPFGVRIPEHVMWAREATRTDREADQDHGLALSYTGEAWRGEAMLVAGNYQIRPDRYRERGYSAFLEGFLSEHNTVGLSSLVLHAERDRISLDSPMTRHAHGVFARLTPLTRLVLLTESDLLLKTGRDAGYVGFAQLDYELVQGLHLMATSEALDEGFAKTRHSGVPAIRTPGFGAPRYGQWLTLDWFCLPQIELRIDAVFRQRDPTRLLAQLHVYL